MLFETSRKDLQWWDCGARGKAWPPLRKCEAPQVRDDLFWGGSEGERPGTSLPTKAHGLYLADLDLADLMPWNAIGGGM